jgi:hypothetical protein
MRGDNGGRTGHADADRAADAQGRPDRSSEPYAGRPLKRATRRRVAGRNKTTATKGAAAPETSRRQNRFLDAGPIAQAEFDSIKAKALA